LAGSACNSSNAVRSPPDAPRVDSMPSSEATPDVAVKSDVIGPSDRGVTPDGLIRREAADESTAQADWKNACSVYARALCQRAFACYAFIFLNHFKDVQHCEDRYGGTDCERQVTSVGSTIAPRDLESCATALSAQSCAKRLLGRPRECLWQGSLQDNATCTYDLQCQSGWCDLVSGTWCGSCKPKIPFGDSCPNPGGAGCQEGLMCGSTICSISVKDGGVCRGTEIVTCGNPIPAGSPCLWTFDCAWGNACIGGLCAPWKELGEACEGDDYYACNLEKDEFCPYGTGGTRCTAITRVGIGENCAVLGAFCTGDARCTKPDAGSSYFCTPPLEDGAFCDSTSECRFPSLCIDGKCRTAADVAGSCK